MVHGLLMYKKNLIMNHSIFEDQKINEQVNLMISYKYEFINYNGLRNSHLASLTNNYTINPFSNKVIIIDEAHNFISRIVNKLSRPSSLSMKMYNYLMEAENCKIILLSGTPIINYPHEVAILFNILRGYIYTFTTKINDTKVNGKVITQDYLIDLFQKKEYIIILILLNLILSLKNSLLQKIPSGL